MLIILLAVVGGLLALFVVFFLMTYTVVKPNEAHVAVIGNGGRKVYSPNPVARKNGSAYFYIPLFMKRVILPLGKVKIEIDSFKLRDKNVAPAVCDVVTWLSINDPELVVESISLHESSFEDAVRDTLQAQVSGIARAAAMNSEILDLMRDRTSFGNIVQGQVNGALRPFGLDLIQLEIIDFSDAEESHVIQDYEEMRQSEIESQSRQTIALQNKEAEVTEAENQRIAGIAKQHSQQEIQISEIKRNELTQSANAEAEMRIAEKLKETNRIKIDALRVKTVGEAEVTKEATITQADGESEAVRITGVAQTEVVRLTGQAEADANKQRGLAEAEILKQTGIAKGAAITAEAEGLAKYNEAGMALERLRALKDIEITKAHRNGSCSRES
jgi:flotillin